MDKDDNKKTEAEPEEEIEDCDDLIIDFSSGDVINNMKKIKWAGKSKMELIIEEPEA